MYSYFALCANTSNIYDDISIYMKGLLTDLFYLHLILLPSLTLAFLVMMRSPTDEIWK